MLFEPWASSGTHYDIDVAVEAADARPVPPWVGHLSINGVRWGINGGGHRGQETGAARIGSPFDRTLEVSRITVGRWSGRGG